MRFNLIDKIVEVQAGVSLKALKNLTLGEEYLADHFPTFPVMPGVLMLQTLVEAGAWLLRISEDFAHSVIVLREAKNIKYGNFMEPGKQMLITV
jgi:3-hydroxyacyl-[acyl-carrier-protein] dehydratase